jgi:acetolactate synthase I/II/III large subunit
MNSQHSEPKSRIGADVVVEQLEQHGVEYVFSVPGGKVDSILHRLSESKVKTIVCRHEQNAAFIAGGIGRMTGKAGVAMATSGPGISNLVTGLATANTEGDPIVALGGSVPLRERLKKVHQAIDGVSLCKPVTKYSAEVDSPEALSETLTNAFRSAESDRPGAAFVSLPMDILTGATPCDVLKAPYSGLGPANSAAIQEAARLINKAKCPVVLLGLLASRPQNADAIRELVKCAKLPVVGTFQAAGALSVNLFSNFGGRVGQINNQPADELLSSGDLVLAIGYDPVEYWPSIWNRGNRRLLVHLDVQPADIDNDYSPAVELIGDITATALALTSQISRPALESSASKILAKIARDREELAQASASLGGNPIHPLRLVAELQRMMATDTTLCLDMGSFHLWMARHLYSFRARQILISNGQQTLGVALPWAIAATLVRPAEKVLSISGDGGFLFSAMELETAVRLKSNLVHMVLIDNSYNMTAEQAIIKHGRASGTDFGPVDPVKFADAFGAKGFMIDSPDQITPVLQKAFQIPGPVLIGARIDNRDNRGLFEKVDHRSIH